MNYFLSEFDNGTFGQQLESHLAEGETDVVLSFIKNVNALGYNQFDTTDKNTRYIADALITQYIDEFMRYSGEKGYRKVLLRFNEIAQGYINRMTKYDEMKALTKDEIKDAGYTLNNYAEDPESLTKSISDAGLLKYISNQSYDKTVKGGIEAIDDYYNGLKVAKTKNYVSEFKDLFGQMVYYPMPYMEFDADEDEDED